MWLWLGIQNYFCGSEFSEFFSGSEFSVITSKETKGWENYLIGQNSDEHYFKILQQVQSGEERNTNLFCM
jgi:hypothetical protein